MSIQKSAYQDSDSDSESDVSRVLSEASSVSSYQLKRKDKGTKNVVDRKDVFQTQKLEESFKMSKNYKKYGTSDKVKKISKTVENKRYHLRSDNDETLDSIEPVTGNSKKGNRNPMKQQTERSVQMTKKHREYSFEQKRSCPKNKRNRPSSPEETNKKQKIQIDDFFQNASILPDGSDSEGIRSTKPAYQTSEETTNNDRRRKDQENGKTAKRSVRNTRNSSFKKKKAEEEVRSVYNEGYYTDNINSDSLHQESEYQDITDDDNNQKNRKKKANKKDDWSDKALEDFLETLREQPVKEMNDRRNKWIMFSKRLEKKGTKKNNDECRKQVFRINLLSDEKGVWGMHTGGNPEYAPSMIHKITLVKLKIVIIVNHCYLIYFQYAKMMRIFQKYTRQTGASGNISPMNKKIIDVFSAFKHVEADIVGSLSGSRILNSGNEITLTVTVFCQFHIWCSILCSTPCMSLLVGHLFNNVTLQTDYEVIYFFLKHNIWKLIFIEIHKFKKNKMREEDEDDSNDQQSDAEATGNEGNVNNTLFAFL